MDPGNHVVDSQSKYCGRKHGLGKNTKGSESLSWEVNPVTSFLPSSPNFRCSAQHLAMTTFNLGGATFQSGISLPSLGKAKADTGLKVPKVGSISSNVGVDLSKGLSGVTGDVQIIKDNHNDSRNGAADSESIGDLSHQAVSSYFLGPQAENMGYFRKNVDEILKQLEQARLNYFPEDGVR